MIPASDVKAENEKVTAHINPQQVNPVLKFVDSTQSEQVKQSIFGKLATECLYSRNLHKWIESYDDIYALILWVNVEKKSRFWDRLEFNSDETILE